MNLHKKRFLWTLCVQILVMAAGVKVFYDYVHQAEYIWWQGRFMDPVGHFIYLEVGIVMLFFGLGFIQYMNWYRWIKDPNKRF